MSDKETIKIKIKAPLLGYKVGSIVTLAVDRGGRIVNKYWASRVIDAKDDDCVEIISDKKGDKKSPSLKKGEK